jgi:hypothetical protein
MENFFTVILILTVCVLLFIFYYTGKTVYRSTKRKKTANIIRKKYYEDEKHYTRNFLRVQLRELESGSIRWLQIYSRNFPEQKIEILYDTIQEDIRIQNRWQVISEEKLNRLSELGITEHDRSGELHSFHTPVNAKIVTDVIYYTMEKIYNQKYTQTLKFVSSGGH